MMNRMKKKPFSVSIVLPNWNGAHLLEKNLPSVIAAAPHAEIIVSDDASVDGSVGLLREKFPQVAVVENTTRQGFAGNVNSGVSRSTGDIVVLLNTDVRPEPGFLSPLLSWFSDPTVAAVGCLEQSHEARGIVLRGRGIAKWERGYFIHSRGETDVQDTAWVSGGSSAYRRSVWEKLGGMDAIYNPFYWEDIDLSYQILKSGYRIGFERKSVVGHFHEEGKIKTAYTPDDVKRIVYRNQYIFLWKNISDLPLLISHCVWTPVRLCQAVVRGDWPMILGYLMAIGTVPAILKSRMRARRHWRRNDADIFPSS